ncbi:MAG: GNAT family N-acetyltransferase [Chloroflexi bacterium]|nr:GNAT family N-acetyltransferase [Chloroflexota bacterium]
MDVEMAGCVQSVRIREALVEDVPRITGLYQADGFPLAWGDSLRSFYLFTCVLATRGRTLIALANGEMAGHLEVVLAGSASGEGRDGFITALEIGKGWRRRGIARALVGEACRWVRSRGGAHLGVVPEDEAALAFYRAVGFVPGTDLIDIDVRVSRAQQTLTPPLRPVRALAPAERPWRGRRHVAGMILPAAYCWARTVLAAPWNLPEAENTGGWELEGGAVLLADPTLLHLLLPEGTDPCAAQSQDWWSTLLQLRADNRDGFAHTVVSRSVGECLGWLRAGAGHDVHETVLMVRNCG